MNKKLKFLLGGSPFLAILLPLPAHSVELNYSLFSDIAYSDNLTTANNGTEGGSITVGTNLNFEASIYNDWTLSLLGTFSHIEYSIDTLSNEQRKTGIGRLEYQPTTNNFSLSVTENISQVPQNRFSNLDVNNVRDVRVTTIQPGYFVNLSGSNTLTFEVTYVDLDNGEFDDNGPIIDGSRETEQYTIGYERQISALNTISLIGERSKTLFDGEISDGVIDFDQDDLLVRWLLQGTSTQVQVDYGVSYLTNELGDEDDSDLYSISVNRQLNSSNALFFSSSKEFNNLLRTRLDADNPIVDDDLANFGSAVEIKDTVLRYTATSSIFSSSVNLTYRKLGATEIRNAEKRTGFGLSATYFVSRALNSNTESNLTFNYSRSKNEFDTDLSTVRVNEVELYSIAYNFSYSSELNLYARISSRKTEQNDQSNGDSNTLGIGFTYNPTGPVF